MELSEKIPWVWTGLMIGASSIFTAYHVQYLLLDAELRAKITQPEDAAQYLVLSGGISGGTGFYQ